MEAGTLMKLAETCLQYIIEKASSVGINATQACRDVDAYCAKVYVAQPRNSNIEIGGMALLPMPHGITAHLLVGKSLDGHARCTVARLLQMYVASSDLFNDEQKRAHCCMFDEVWRCRELMTWPLHRCRLVEVQALLNDMDRNLIRYMLPSSPSGCMSAKHHQWAHYCLHRQSTGCSAKEYAFERSYAVGHKKQVQFTNKSKTKAVQTSAKHWFRNGVHRLAIHLQIDDKEEVRGPVIRTDELVNPTSLDKYIWTSDAVRMSMVREANAMHPALVLTRASTTLNVTLKNRMTIPGKPERLVPVILRAQHSGKIQWVDNIKVQYRDDNDNPAVGFGQCLGFFGDAADYKYVAIQWYKIVGRQPIQRVSRMTKVELIESYQYVPVGSILNGALIVPINTVPQPGFSQQFWVIQSHREGTSLQSLNS